MLFAKVPFFFLFRFYTQNLLFMVFTLWYLFSKNKPEKVTFRNDVKVNLDKLQKRPVPPAFYQQVAQGYSDSVGTKLRKSLVVLYQFGVKPSVVLGAYAIPFAALALIPTYGLYKYMVSAGMTPHHQPSRRERVQSTIQEKDYGYIRTKKVIVPEGYKGPEVRQDTF